MTLYDAYREYMKISLACHASGAETVLDATARVRRGCLSGCRRAWVRYCGALALDARRSS